MRSRTWTRAASIVCIVALLAPYTAALAQEAQSFVDIIAGKTFPLSMKPKDLPADFKPVRIRVAGTGGGGLMDMMSAMMSPFTMMMGGTSSNDAEGGILLTVAEVNWTKGDVVKVQGKDFMVTYKWNLDLAQMASQPKDGDPGAAKAEALRNMELSLALVAVDGITGISPMTNFTRDDLVKLIEKPYEPKPLDTRPADPSEDAPMASGDPQQESVSRAKQIGLGVIMYSTDYDDVFPYAQSTKAVQYVTYPYMKNVDLWNTLNPNKSTLLYNRAMGGSSSASVETPSETILFYEDRPWADGRRIIIFVDSHVALVDDTKWKELEPTLRLKLPKIGKPLPLNYGLDWQPAQ